MHTMKEPVTIKLAEFVSQLSYEQISDKAIESIKMCLLDTIGCALWGSTTDWGRIVNDFVKSQQGVREATLWATDFVGPAVNVVLGNGTMSHSFDFDDYHMTKLHPGAVVVPAALAIGEKERIDGKRLMVAMIAGYETMIHISDGLNPGASRVKGWHLTGTCGTFAAAAAVGNIWRLDTTTMASALGMAGTQSSGLWAFTADGSFSKRFHPGRASQSGIIATDLAQRGYHGPTQILEAEDGGFFNATSYDFDLSKVLENLGTRFETENIILKPYPACGSLHSSIDGALILMRENRIQIEEIEKVNVYNSEVVNLQCGFDYAPLGPLQAQMSLKYCVARAIFDGKLTVAQFQKEKLSEPAVLDLVKRVHFVKDDEINRIYPRAFPSIVEIVLNDGQTYKVRVDSQTGSTGNPMSREEIINKFKTQAADIIPEEKADAVIDLILHLEQVEDVSKLADLLRKETTSFQPLSAHTAP